ncbi:MAG: dephospho-CoA kinase [Gammaproteobacteria bacterium]|nr:dephospho-CoA kinase [Gammaproteobacteria bacterium]
MPVTFPATKPPQSGNNKDRPLVVGLTGGIGSGKSTVADLFTELGVPVIDADRLARELVNPGQPAFNEIIAQFGDACLQPDGTLDRAWLQQRIFSDPPSKQQLEAILHPKIRQRMQELIAEIRAPYCLAVIPLLLETRQTDLVDRIVVVDLPEKEQLKRVAARDSLPQHVILDIMSTQADRETRLAAADDIIDNDTDTAALGKRIQELHMQFMEITHGH